MIKFRPGYHEWLVIKDDEVIYSMELDLDEELEDNEHLEYYIDNIIDVLNEELEENEEYDILDKEEKEQLRKSMRCQLRFLVAA